MEIEMAQLDKLLNDLCPDGVEYKTLEELFLTRNGYTPSKTNPEYWRNGTIPWFRMEDIRANGRILTQALQYVSDKAIKDKPFPANSIIVATSATIGEHALLTVESLANQRFTYLILKEQYKSLFDIKFLYYYCFKLDKFCLQHLKLGNFASVDMSKFAKFLFPIPPLEVQQEIVRILDQFTQLTAELNAELDGELNARKHQYEYYLNQILEFEDVPIWVELRTVTKSVTTGLNPRRFFKLNTGDASNYYVTIRELQNNSVVFSEKTDRINDEALRLCNNRSNLEIGDILFSGTGTIGETAVIEKTPTNWNIKEGVYSIKPLPEKVNSRFLMYLLHTNKIRSEIFKKVAGGTVKSIPMGELRKLKIPVPPLSEQERLIKLIDRFDALCNDLTSGLPAEIAARQKQYEYYRDKLLTFKEKV